MIARIIELLSAFIVATISALGYSGVVLLMAIESACIPLPSEIIMPFSGYLVYTGRFNLWLVSIAGAFGCVVGSLVAYWAGVYGGRPLIERYGRYVLISRHDLDLADRWFVCFGEAIVFASRMLPVIRTFIAFPAGVARMNLKRFVIYTFAGSLPWCFGLAYVGQKLGEQWNRDETLKSLFHRFDFLIAIAGALAVVWWVRRHFKKDAKERFTPEMLKARLDGLVEKLGLSVVTSGLATVIFGAALVGSIVGGSVGFLLRPTVPAINAQLPFATVISRGANLRGIDQVLVPLAQTSFNYVLAGVILGIASGAIMGYMIRTKR